MGGIETHAVPPGSGVTPVTTVRRRASIRRDEIITAAGELFADRGYPRTGIDDVGAAVGIAGTGIYKHFDSKADMLVAVIERATDRLLERVDAISRETSDPSAVSVALVDNLIDTVVDEPAPFVVMMWERQHLDRPTLRGLDRAHRLHIEEWVRGLTAVHPDLPDGEAQVIVHAVIGLTMTACYRMRAVNVEELRRILRRMSLEILERGSGVDDGLAQLRRAGR